MNQASSKSRLPSMIAVFLVGAVIGGLAVYAKQAQLDVERKAREASERATETLREYEREMNLPADVDRFRSRE